MRAYAIFLLAAGVLPAACGEPPGPPPDGELIVFTSTAGAAPATASYVVSVDGLDSLTVGAADTAHLQVPPGTHAVRLRGVPEHCAVMPGASLQVDVPSSGPATVRFDVRCAGAGITTVTTGLELDRNGYHVSVNGIDTGVIGEQDSALVQLGPGTWSLTLTDVAPNCAVQGPPAREVTVADADVVSIHFVVRCTATTGDLRISVTLTGPDVGGESFEATIDGRGQWPVTMDQPVFVAGLPVGTYVISLHRSAHCVVTGDDSRTLILGGRTTRDTARLEFPVTCTVPPEMAGTVHITAPVTGPVPNGSRFTVWYSHESPWDYGGDWIELGSIDPGSSLVTQLETGEADIGHSTYSFELRAVPRGCQTASQGPLSVSHGHTLDVALSVTCSPGE